MFLFFFLLYPSFIYFKIHNIYIYMLIVIMYLHDVPYEYILFTYDFKSKNLCFLNLVCWEIEFFVKTAFFNNNNNINNVKNNIQPNYSFNDSNDIDFVVVNSLIRLTHCAHCDRKTRFAMYLTFKIKLLKILLLASFLFNASILWSDEILVLSEWNYVSIKQWKYVQIKYYA